MTTTLTNPNTRNAPWSGREKIEWDQLSAWANIQTHIYSININTSAFTSHMQKHLSTSHVNMSQGLQCHCIPMQTTFCCTQSGKKGFWGNKKDFLQGRASCKEDSWCPTPAQSTNSWCPVTPILWLIMAKLEVQNPWNTHKTKGS